MVASSWFGRLKEARAFGESRIFVNTATMDKCVLIKSCRIMCL